MNVLGITLLVVYVVGFIAAFPLTWRALDAEWLLEHSRDEMDAGLSAVMCGLACFCVAAIWPALVGVGAVVIPLAYALGAALKSDGGDAQ